MGLRGTFPKLIVIPLFYDYYLFEYFKFLIPRLLEDGFKVTIVTFDPEIKRKYQIEHNNFQIFEGPLLIKICLGRSGNPFWRVALWLCGWLWGIKLKQKYDFAILPWDNKPLWYIISCCIPSLTSHNTTEFIDIQNTLKRDALIIKTNFQRVIHCLFSCVDYMWGKKFFPRLKGMVLKYKPYLLIDRFMGYRAKNFYLGFSNVRYITVTGERIKENYCTCGFDGRKIFVVGNPNYDHLMELKGEFTKTRQRELKEFLNIPQEKKIFTFFLSLSSFTKEQIEEIFLVISQIHSLTSSSFFILKFHPKTKKEFPIQFRERLQFLGDDFLLITGFQGDEFNAKLILISDFIVQKQSTVGFIAMILRKPIISYNLYPTDYEDDMYKILGGSVHVESIEELESVLSRINDRELWRTLEEKQRRACERFCLATDSANRKISEIILRHFNLKN